MHHDWLDLDAPEVAEWHRQSLDRPQRAWRVAWCNLMHKPFWRKVRKRDPVPYDWFNPHGHRSYWRDVEFRCERCDGRRPLHAANPTPLGAKIVCWIAAVWFIDLITMFPVMLSMSCNWYDDPATLLGLGWRWMTGNSDCWFCCPYRPSWW